MAVLLNPVPTLTEISNLRHQIQVEGKAKVSQKMADKASLRLAPNRSFFIPRAYDKDGNLYEDIEFVILSRFKKNGDTFLSGDPFLLNYSEAMREVLEKAENPED